MKLVFAGTPAAAVPSLAALHGSPHDVALVVTRADAPLGRKRVLTPSPVAEVAARHDLPVLKTNRLDEGATAAIDRVRPDLGVIVAYGGLVREPLLSLPRLGWINLHFSLLPRWRGAAPVQHALIAGDERTGAVVFRLVPGLDAGPVLGRVEQYIPADATAGDLLTRLADTGAELLVEVVDGLSAGTAVAREQAGQVTLAPKLTLEDARIDWRMPAATVCNRVRGVTPEPGAFTVINGARLKLLRVRPALDADPAPPGVIRAEGSRIIVGTGSQPVELVTVQPAGRTAMSAPDWWRGVASAELVAS